MPDAAKAILARLIEQACPLQIAHHAPYEFVSTRDGFLIASIVLVDRDRAESFARLFVAAPGLLAGCRLAVQQCGCTPKQRASGHAAGCWAIGVEAEIASAVG